MQQRKYQIHLVLKSTLKNKLPLQLINLYVK
jgi:hypothetical protein